MTTVMALNPVARMVRWISVAETRSAPSHSPVETQVYMANGSAITEDQDLLRGEEPGN